MASRTPRSRDAPRELVAGLILEYDGRSGRDDIVLILLAVLAVLDDDDNRRVFISVKGPVPVCWVVVVVRRLKITSLSVHRYPSQNLTSGLCTHSP